MRAQKTMSENRGADHTEAVGTTIGPSVAFLDTTGAMAPTDATGSNGLRRADVADR